MLFNRAMYGLVYGYLFVSVLYNISMFCYTGINCCVVVVIRMLEIKTMNKIVPTIGSML